MLRYLLCIALIIGPWLPAARSGEPALSPRDQAELKRLEQTVEKLTDQATQARMNADFVPGMLTVFYGDDLEARGIRTVGEALTLVPGVNLSFTSDSFWETGVRGVPKILASGHIKLLVNHIPLSTAFGVDPVANMPMAQVERIEVIRGPGSTIHGENACAGVMNIITRKSQNRVFGAAASHDRYMAGGVLSWKSKQRPLSLGLNLAGFQTDGADLDAGTDTLYGQGGQGFSYAAGPSNEKMEYRAGLFSLEYRDFSLHAHYLKNQQGDFFGVGQPYLLESQSGVVDISQLPPPDSESQPTGEIAIFEAEQNPVPEQLPPPQPIRAVVDMDQAVPVSPDQNVYESEQKGFYAKQRFCPAPKLHLDLSLGWQAQRFEADAARSQTYSVLPLSTPGAGPDAAAEPISVHIIQDGWIYGLAYQESAFSSALNLSWEPGAGHHLSFEYGLSHTRWTDTRFGEKGADKTLPLLPQNRTAHSLMIRDELRINEQFSLSAGLRYDHYDDIGETFSPQVAAVCRINPHHIIKAQYARAFRPPTFLEFYAFGGTELEPETIDTYELGYIWRRHAALARLTLFYSELRNWLEDSRLQAAPGDFRTQGAELELAFPLFWDCLRLEGNLSYADTEEKATGQEIPESANWLGNLGVLWQPDPDLAVHLRYRYVGERHREPGDIREDLDGYGTVDLTASLYNLGIGGLTLQAGVKNLFEADVRYPSRLETNEKTGAYRLSYPQDYPRPDRWWWVQIGYAF